MVTALFLLAVGWLAWKGPSAALRFAVRIYDPALRLEVGSSFFRDGDTVIAVQPGMADGNGGQ